MASLGNKNKNELATNRILLVFTGAFAAFLLLMLLERNITRGTTFLIAYHMLQGFAVLSALAAAALAALAWRHKEDPKEKTRLFPLRYGLVLCLLLAAASAFMLYYDIFLAIKVLYVAVPSLAVFYMIYHIYPLEFSCHVVIVALSAVGMWVLRRRLSAGIGKAAPVMIVVCVLLIAAAFAIRKIGENGGFAPWNRSLRLLPDRKGAQGLLYATCLLMLAAFVIAMIGGASAAYYAVFAMLGYMLMLAVYFTACLM